MAELEKILCTDSRIEAAKKINAIVDAMGEGDLANIDLSNLSSTGQAKFDEKAYANEVLKKSQITNCLLEVPQNIKLELNNGTLTLKAGSKVIVPNGAGVFDERIVTVDCGFNNTGEITGQYMVFDNSDLQSNTLRYASIGKCVSSTTQPTDTSACWYDLTDNRIKIYQNGMWTGTRTFPLCIISASNGVVTSIDQVFNGFGYIGSTVWVDKGVKGLVPNGRNEDGSLKNTEFTTNRVLTRTFTNTGDCFIFVDGSYISVLGLANYKYDEVNNFNLNVILSTGTYSIHKSAVFGSSSFNNGVISNFQPKLPFRAVDWNDFKEVEEGAVRKDEMQEVSVVTQVYSSGTSWYRIYSPDSTGKRWCEQGGYNNAITSSGATVTLLKPFADTNYTITIGRGNLRPDLAENIYWNVKTTSQFTLVAYRSEKRDADWMACGYID